MRDPFATDQDPFTAYADRHEPDYCRTCGNERCTCEWTRFDNGGWEGADDDDPRYLSDPNF